MELFSDPDWLDAEGLEVDADAANGSVDVGVFGNPSTPAASRTLQDDGMADTVGSMATKTSWKMRSRRMLKKAANRHFSKGEDLNLARGFMNFFSGKRVISRRISSL
ncbi:hypothetical protein D9756_007487 [Leucocoprinus leucothites]|uniref:Uncharacterized protein n=1 Tax=Leucocoprinus leucothites TaxID=201217 RepID=A0A8H5D1L6_9AGAR|nr:hypothetical protein D9756_007487 [Leucoagaricus leucothites]